MPIRLFDYWRSSACYRVRIALNLKGVAHERIAVDLLASEQHTPEHRARNPQGLIPTLEIDGLELTQSLAIIDYLDANYPEPPMVSKDPGRRAKTLAQALAVVADLHPITNLRVLKQLEARFGADQPAREDWYRHWVREGLLALEAMAAGSGRFLGGDAPDMADVCLVPQMYNARRFALPLDDFPTLVRIDAAAQELDAFAAAHPDRVK